MNLIDNYLDIEWSIKLNKAGIIIDNPLSYYDEGQDMIFIKVDDHNYLEYEKIDNGYKYISFWHTGFFLDPCNKEERDELIPMPSFEQLFYLLPKVLIDEEWGNNPSKYFYMAMSWNVISYENTTSHLITDSIYFNDENPADPKIGIAKMLIQLKKEGLI